MRKKSVERNYDRVARAIGRNLLMELLDPYQLPNATALTFETQENIQERLETESLAFFFINALGSCQFVETERGQAFWQLFSGRGLAGNDKIISGTKTRKWQLETGESLIILKVLSQNAFPRKRK